MKGVEARHGVGVQIPGAEPLGTPGSLTFGPFGVQVEVGADHLERIEVVLPLSDRCSHRSEHVNVETPSQSAKSDHCRVS